MKSNVRVCSLAAARVVLALWAGLGVEVLDGGVATHIVLLAQVFARGSAISITDDDGRRISILGTKLVPSRLHRLTMPSPRREELDKGRLA